MLNILSIRSKLILFSIIFILIPILVVGILLFITSIDILGSEISISLQNQLAYVADNIDYTLRNIEYSTTDMLVNERLISYLSVPDAELSYENYQKQQFILNLLRGKVQTNRFDHSIFLYSSLNEQLFLSNAGGYMNGEDLAKAGWSGWMDQFKLEKSNASWLICKEFRNLHNAYDTEKDNSHTVSCEKEISKLYTGEKIGSIFININENYIFSLLDRVNTDKGGYTYIVDQNSQFISLNNDEEISSYIHGTEFINSINNRDQGYYNQEIDGKSYLISYYTSGYTEWKYVIVIPSRYIYSKIIKVAQFTIAVSALAFILALLGVFSLSKSIYHPIKKLMISMEKAGKGNFSTSVDANRKDEFGKLNESYNIMISQIKNLIDELYRQKLLQKESKLRLLQSQINPHFLYNVMDTIHWMARLNKTDEVCKIAFAMSKLYRISLSDGRNMVAVENAIDLARQYLTIQQIRNNNRFEFCIEIDDDIRQYTIPKLIFQPLVENAVKHGLEKIRQNGNIVITGTKREDNMLFTVKDNGVGIESDKLNYIKGTINKTDFNEEGNFALKNLNQQIKIIYGDNYGIDIESAVNEGTIVTIEVPALKNTDEQDGIFQGQIEPERGKV